MLTTSTRASMPLHAVTAFWMSASSRASSESALAACAFTRSSCALPPSASDVAFDWSTCRGEGGGGECEGWKEGGEGKEW